jgi:osmotically-inducible protein OsmY
MYADPTIRDNVLAELDFEPSLDASGVGVAVKAGVATLTGHVGSYTEKLIAEEAARRVRGVRAVAIELDVRLPAEAKTNDDEIAARAASIIAWQMPAIDTVSVSVEKGWIILRGEVNYYFEREDAERAVRKLSGVLGVTNTIKVRPSVTTRDIRERIAGALERSAELEAAAIRVSVDGGKVTLTGHVKAWNERAVAERAAWAAPGVTQVVDHIDVAP